MTWAAAHEIAACCRFLSLAEAKAFADCLPVDGLCAVNNDDQLLDLSVRHRMLKTDPIVALHWSITSKGGGCPSHATRGGRSRARARGMLHAERPGPCTSAFSQCVYMCVCVCVCVCAYIHKDTYMCMRMHKSILNRSRTHTRSRTPRCAPPLPCARDRSCLARPESRRMASSRACASACASRAPGTESVKIQNARLVADATAALAVGGFFSVKLTDHPEWDGSNAQNDRLHGCTIGATCPGVLARSAASSAPPPQRHTHRSRTHTRIIYTYAYILYIYIHIYVCMHMHIYIYMPIYPSI